MSIICLPVGDCNLVLAKAGIGTPGVPGAFLARKSGFLVKLPALNVDNHADCKCADRSKRMRAGGKWFEIPPLAKEQDVEDSDAGVYLAI